MVITVSEQYERQHAKHEADDVEVTESHFDAEKSTPSGRVFFFKDVANKNILCLKNEINAYYSIILRKINFLITNNILRYVSQRRK